MVHSVEYSTQTVHTYNFYAVYQHLETDTKRDKDKLEEHTSTHSYHQNVHGGYRMSTAYLPISFILCCPIYLAGLCRRTYLPIQGADASDLFSFALLLSFVPSRSVSCCMHPRFVFFPCSVSLLFFVLPSFQMYTTHLRQVITTTLPF